MSGVEILNQVFSLSTLIANVFLILVVLVMFYKKPNFLEKFFIFIKKYSYQIIFFLSSSGILGSLIYSEIVEYAPCTLCWWQRVFLYPIAIITVLALLRKDKGISSYILGLSIPGGLIALYQSILQVSSSLEPFVCSGSEVDCSSAYFVQFGFVTLPFMAFSIFALITALSILSNRS